MVRFLMCITSFITLLIPVCLPSGIGATDVSIDVQNGNQVSGVRNSLSNKYVVFIAATNRYSNCSSVSELNLGFVLTNNLGLIQSILEFEEDSAEKYYYLFLTMQPELAY
jgi:hypothetical protein